MSNTQNTQTDLLQALRNAKDATEKTALIAESSLAKLPPDIATVARRLVILHWFDEEIVAALRPAASQTDPDTLFERLQSLSFIEAVPEGLTYHALTRTGLIQRLLAADPEPLISGAKLAAPVYAAREERLHHLEAFYCDLLAGETAQAAALLEDLLVWTGEGDDWSTQLQLFELRDEAESYPFVPALERTASHHFSKGLAHHELGELERAIADYNEAIRLNPEDATAFNNRGIAYRDKGELERAIADYNEALRLNPEYATAFYNRGIAYSDKGELERAIADYNEALRLNPDYASAYYNKACAYALQEKVAEMLPPLRRALELDRERYLALIATDSDFDGVRGEARFEALLAEFGAGTTAD